MTMFHIIEPEVAGDIGQASVLDHSTHPPTVLKLEYEFNVWLGDDLLATYPCLIVTERLHAALIGFRGSGYSFDEVDISTTEDFYEISECTELPHFFWMKVHGKPGVDDIGLTKDSRIIVSDRFLNLLRSFVMEHCLVRRKPFRSTATE